MTVNTFLDITPKEFYHALEYKEKYDVHIVKATIRPICETLRTQTWYLMNIQLPRGKKIVHEKKLMQFEWDAEDIRKPQTKKQMVATMKDIAMYM